MLSAEEFTSWCRKLELFEPTRKLVERIRESEPSRAVSGRFRNVIGAYPSRKMGRTIHFESHKVELPGIYLKEHNRTVLEYYDQPPQIKLAYKSGKNERAIAIYHTPDFFVLYKDRAGWEEWKSEEELIKLALESPNRYISKNGEWHCPPGEEYAKQFGLHYWVRSSKEFNWTLQRNMVFLEDYYLENKTDLSVGEINKVKSLVTENPGILLANLISMSDVGADMIYKLVVREEIYIDIEQELICESETCHVYRCREISVSHQTIVKNRKDSLFANCSIDISQGKEVLWDGNPWTIINIGDSSITLNSKNGMTVLERKRFAELVSQNYIKSSNNQIISIINEKINSKLTEASEQDIVAANHRYEIILPYLEGEKIKETDSLEVTTRTVRNWIRSYKQAEQIYGAGYLGLIPCIRHSGNRTQRLSKETIAEMDTVISDSETVTNQSKKILYGKLISICDKKGIIAPSQKSFYRMINSKSQYQRTRKTQGSRIAYKSEEFYFELDMTTPRHGDRPFEVAHIDHTEVDLETVHSITGKRLGKFWLTIMLDAFSRRVLAFFITYNKPSYVSDMMVIRECVRRFNRLPQIIVTDNGSDFKSVYFQQLLACFGITHKFRPPHKSRFGSVGERYFGTLMTQLIHNLRGNTKIMKNARQVTKSVNPKNFATWTLPHIFELLTAYFYELYDTNEHSSLGESPREVFERSIAHTGMRRVRYISYDEDFIIMTLPSVKRNGGTSMIDSLRGVRVNYFYYYSSEFNNYIDKTRVPVRFDPWNIGIVYCYIHRHWEKCYSQFYNVLKNRTEYEIQLASEELLKQKRCYAKNAKVTAKELANFIERAEQTEKVLTQRFYDEEMDVQLKVINNTTMKEKTQERPRYQNNVVTYPHENMELDFNIDDE